MTYLFPPIVLVHSNLAVYTSRIIPLSLCKNIHESSQIWVDIIHMLLPLFVAEIHMINITINNKMFNL